MVKKRDFNTKATEIEGKIPSISGSATNSVLTAVENIILDVSSLVTKTDFDTKLQDISKRITSNKSRHLQIESKLKKLEKFDASYCRGKNYFEEDGTQNYFVFQPMLRYFKRIAVLAVIIISILEI